MLSCHTPKFLLCIPVGRRSKGIQGEVNIFLEGILKLLGLGGTKALTQNLKSGQIASSEQYGGAHKGSRIHRATNPLE